MRPHSIVYFGTYETAYPRNVLMIEKFKRDGCNVTECSVPLLNAFEHKTLLLKNSFTVLRLLIRAVYCYVRLVAALLYKHRKVDAICIGYIGQFDMLIVYPFAKILRKKLYFNALISLYDTMVMDRKVYNPRSLSGRILWIIDYLSFHAADTVIIDTEAHKQYIAEEFRLSPDRIDVVPIDAEEQFRPLDIPKSEEDRDHFIVLFYGKFIPLQGIDVMLRAMNIIQRRDNDRIRLRMIGQGQLHNEMRALALQLQLQNIDWVDWIPYEELPKAINAADICLGIFGDSEKAGRVVPNKVWQCLRCGKKVITRHMSIPEKHELFTNVISVNHTPEALAEAIMEEAKRSLVSDPHTAPRVLHSTL